MRKKILLGIGAWLSLVLAIIVGVAVGMMLYLTLLYQFTLNQTYWSNSVETRDVPVEESQVIPIEHDGETGN